MSRLNIFLTMALNSLMEHILAKVLRFLYGLLVSIIINILFSNRVNGIQKFVSRSVTIPLLLKSVYSLRLFFSFFILPLCSCFFLSILFLQQLLPLIFLSNVHLSSIFNYLLFFPHLFKLIY